MNIRAISRNVGIALIVSALFMFLSVLVSIIYGVDSSFSPLLLSGILTFLAGIFPIIFVPRIHSEINTREGVVIIVVSWILSCVFGMMPYVLWGGEFTLVNAWFESASGFTTTGGTILTDIEALPHGLLFWRSSTNYIGGLGVVLFLLIILPNIGSVKWRISRMEVSDVSKVNYNYRTNKIVKVILSVYLGLTAVMFVLLLLAGMTPFDAINHSFTAMATGGFSTKNASVGAFNSPWIETIFMVFMVLASIHFGLIYSSVKHRDFKVFKDPIVRFYLLSILFASVFISINLLTSGTYDNLWEALRNSLFNVISLGSSSGFTISDTAVWPTFSIMILIYMSIQCGCSGSTTGGMKADRVLIILKATRSQLLRTLHPNAVVPVKYGKNVADPSMVQSVTVFALFYILCCLVFALVYAAIGLDFTDSLTGSVAMIGNIGPAFGNLGAFSNFAAVPTLAKFVMGVEMIAGRLGLYAMVILFIFNKRV
ncbi:MAG: TrkH family potassium uptake protein [Bacteroidales bacterium]|nr:TrkH family potassium uptake protein [Bacteroidales bacterium]